MRVLTLDFKGDVTEVHLLNVGESFPPDFDPDKRNGFGGSRYLLTAGRDFARASAGRWRW